MQNNYVTDNVLHKYLNNQLDLSDEKNILLKLDDSFIIQCKGKTLLLKGEMLLIVGAKNSGKSKAASYLVKQLLIPEPNEGFVVQNCEEIRAVVFDSEMGESRLAKWWITNTFSEFDSAFLQQLELYKRLTILSTKRKKPKERLKYVKLILDQLKNDFPNSHLVVCLDIATCLTDNPNDPGNKGIVDEFYSLMDKATFIVVSHTNFKSELNNYSTGSIGTEFEKIASTKLVVENKEDKHKLAFAYSKQEDQINSENDYFYLHTKKISKDSIHISGISDSNGIEIKKIRNEKKTIDEVFTSILSLLSTLNEDDLLRLEKNIVFHLIDDLKIGKSKAYADIKTLIENERLLKNGELIFINSK